MFLNKMSPSVINFKVYGLNVGVYSSSSSFLEFVEKNYSYFLSEENITEKEDLRIEFNPFSKTSSKARDYISKSKNLYHEERGLQISYRDFQGTLHISAKFEISLKNLSRLLLRKIARPLDSAQYYIFQRAIRICLTIPLIYELWQKKGMNVLHGSAVEGGGGGIIFGGLDGVGKSTLANYLVLEYNFKFLADNFCLFQGKKLFPFPVENIRVSKDSPLFPFVKERVGSTIKISGYPSVYGKSSFIPGLGIIGGKAQPKIFFLVSFGYKTHVEPLSCQEAFAKMETIHDFLGELPRYSYLSLMNYGYESRKELENTLERLFSGMKCYRLVISKNMPLPKVADKILSYIK